MYIITLTYPNIIEYYIEQIKSKDKETSNITTPSNIEE